MSFALPEVPHSDSLWGPAIVASSQKGKETFVPFSRNERIGRIVDWVMSAPGTFPSRPGQSSARPSSSAAGPSSAPAAAARVDADAGFSAVSHSKSKLPAQQSRRFVPGNRPGVGGRGGFGAIRPGQGSDKYNAADNRRGQDRLQNQGRRYGGSGGGYHQRGFQPQTAASLEIPEDWSSVAQIALAPLGKMTLRDVPEVEDLKMVGVVNAFDKSLDRLNTKTPKPLERFDTDFFCGGTKDDSILKTLASENTGTVYATDRILAALMAAPRSVLSWDITFTRSGRNLYLDKRDGQLDFVPVNETSHKAPAEDGSINSTSALAQESAYINQNFSQQVLDRKAIGRRNPGHPFATANDSPAPVGYRYRRWHLTDDIVIVARCEVDALAEPASKDKKADSYVLVRALNEYDSRVTGIDWRAKLDQQRGSILAAEIEANSNKVARWAAQAVLAGADAIKLGFVSRTTPKDVSKHSIVGVHTCKPKEIGAQMNFTAQHMWACLKTILEEFMKLPDGKYIAQKDPSKAVLNVNTISDEGFLQSFGDDGELDMDDDFQGEGDGEDVSAVIDAGLRSQSINQVQVEGIDLSMDSLVAPLMK